MTEVFVVAPPSESGGPELAHQLVHHLNTEQPGRAAIVYEPFEIAHRTPKPYRRYDVRPARFDDITPGSTVVLPEVYGRLLDGFPGCRVMFWWMSVNNFHRAAAGAAREQIDALRRNADVHLYQSEYARRFLATAHLEPAQRLSDQLATDYLGAITVPPSSPRRDLVAFNPAKGRTRTELVLFALAKSLRPPQVVALQGLTRAQIRSILAEAKIYVDFGEHPGKDRLPREAAALGCCVLTNRRGAAANPVDVPIPPDCKINDRKPGWERRAANKIRQVLNDFDREAPRFDGYRRMIAGEPQQFADDVAAVFSRQLVSR